MRIAKVRLNVGAAFVMRRMMMIGFKPSRREHAEYERAAEILTNGVLRQIPLDHPESEIWDNRRKRSCETA
jgi:hypothetical protein